MDSGVFIDFFRGFTRVVFRFEIKEVAKFVDRRHGVIPSFELLTELDQSCDNTTHDEFTCHELSKADLLTED